MPGNCRNEGICQWSQGLALAGAAAGLGVPGSARVQREAVSASEVYDLVPVEKDREAGWVVWHARWAGINSYQDTPIPHGDKELPAPRPCSLRSWRTAGWERSRLRSQPVIRTSTRPLRKPSKGGVLNQHAVVNNLLRFGSECRSSLCFDKGG